MRKVILIAILAINDMRSLQSQFVASKGKPVHVDQEVVVQMDKLPITRRFVKVTFERKTADIPQGVALKSTCGKIRLVDGREAKLVYIWNLNNDEKRVECKVVSPDSELRIWNIYKTPGSVSEADYWTNNAGMIIDSVTPYCRSYRCSDGIGEFRSDDLQFRVELID